MRRKRFSGWDWRIWGSSLLTILWLGAGAAYLATAVGWSFWQAEVDDIGGFFEGFFAPLAFLWLVVGLFIQQQELGRTRDEMERAPPAVSGNALFFRLDAGGPLLFCATVEGERMAGRGETQHGDVFAFTASREDKV